MKARQRDLLRQRGREYEDYFRRVNYERSIMAISPNLGSYKYLGQGEQGVMLLNHLALLFGNRTFDPHKAPEEICGFVFTKGRAHGSAELQDAHVYLLTYPLSWITYGGLSLKRPRGVE